MPRITAEQAGGDRRCAFLDMLAVSELGEQMLADPASQDGYLVIVGSMPDKLILAREYTDHPRRLIDLPSLGIKSSAAGRYQFIRKTWDWARESLDLSSFRPINQDRAALFLIDYRKATQAIDSGDIEKAIHLCRKEWASLPGAGYGQNEHSLDHLMSAYSQSLESMNTVKGWYDEVDKRS